MAASQIQSALLVIADIGGYTRFMKLTRFNLAHAQQVVADLLVAVIDAAEPLKLSKLEGDAALFWHPVPADAKQLADVEAAVLRVRDAFLAKRTQMAADNNCTCDACQQIANLKIKFVAHQGEVALQKVKRHTELAGVDVILVHRMLKNNVPVNEYVLVTDEVHGRLTDSLKTLARTLAHDFEGIGEVQTHYVDLSQVAVGQTPQPRQGPLRRFWETIRKNTAALPQLVGITRPLDQGYERTRDAITPPGGG